ncbi:hypothetical protein B9J90_08950 [Vibrio sp. V09_P4A23P171]|uniref:hypothetical protein n=1 Tax=Vibrio sp. V09_P4A23P171 TaxID=1938664 RepID=UPI000B8E4F17|nr:hypothetical protein [Vibrio sp. V09_P4A23P171]OXX36241.1 hypothetical protein B9J90_08950 [Vibrio sp. V09_P4A23P171]
MSDFRINKSINAFVADHIDLHKDTVQKGRNSRNWLLDQLESMAQKVEHFPPRYTDRHKGFGSFHRSTKKQPLDDIDQLFCFSARGDMHYSEVGSTVYINIAGDNEIYGHLTSTNDNTKLSSIKMVNLMVSSLDSIGQYKNTPHRNGEAATLQAAAYDWNFDIVPCFFTAADANGKDYYLIPDGSGNWKKTDPREDKNRSARINQSHRGQILQLIRIIKYWNKRQTMATMGSYLLENMVLDYFENNKPSEEYIEFSIRAIFDYIANAVYFPVNDPKGIQGNLNNLDFDKMKSISERAKLDSLRLHNADQYEFSNPDKAINELKAIFGSDFVG